MKFRSLMLFVFCSVLVLTTAYIASAQDLRAELVNSNTSNEDFVRSLYNKILQREPDPSGFNNWMTLLNNGTKTREQVYSDFVNSEELRGRVNMNTDTPVKTPVTSGGDGETITSTPTSTPTSVSDTSSGNNEDFVRMLYKKLLRREADAQGLKGWVGALDSGKMTRKEIVDAIMNSPERKSLEGTMNTTSINDMLGGNTPVISTGDAQGGETESKKVVFGPKPAGMLEFETAGIVHQDKPTINGDGEYIFLTLRGENFRRLLLIHASGNGRAVRYGLNCREIDTLRMEVASDNLPGWHKWTVKWGNGKISVYLDDRRLGEENFSGIPNHCIVGGNENSKRNFLGRWRNFKVK